MFMVGANDGQSFLEGDGTVVAQFDTPEWTEAYRQRVAGIMDLAGGDGRRMVWVGEPNVGTGNVQRAVQIGNQLAQEEAATRPWVTYVDVAALLAGPDGGFAEYITLPDGSTARCYAGDGVHLSVKCLDRVMDELPCQPCTRCTARRPPRPRPPRHPRRRRTDTSGVRWSGSQPSPRRIGSCSHTAAIAPSDSAGPNGKRLSPRATRAIPPMISPSTAPNNRP